MNDSETANDQAATCAAPKRLFGRLLSREYVRSYLGSHSSSWLTLPKGVSLERDLVESTQASSVRWAIRLINDHYGPHRSPWYRRSSFRALAGDAGGSAAMAPIASSWSLYRIRQVATSPIRCCEPELNLVGWYRYQFQSSRNRLNFYLYVPNTKNTSRGE